MPSIYRIGQSDYEPITDVDSVEGVEESSRPARRVLGSLSFKSFKGTEI
jgi:hypothetical protein